MRVKKPKKTPRAARTARTARSKKAAAGATPNYAWVTSSRAIVSGMIFIVVAAAFLTAREDVPRVDVEREQLSPAALTFETDTAPPLKATTTPAAQAPTLATSKPLAVSIEPAVDEPQAEPAQEPEHATPVTITGCLERDEGTFRLTGASGANAPMSRSWKSGFLKKRPAHIDLADAVGTLGLRNHIGRRVAATGTLIDRELRAHSVRAVGSCE